MAFWTANSPQLQWRCHNDHCCRTYRPAICPCVCVYVCMYFTVLMSYKHTYIYGKLYVSLSTKQSSLSFILLFPFAVPKVGSGALNMMSLDFAGLLHCAMPWAYDAMTSVYCHWLVYLITLTVVINFIGGIDSLCRTHPHLNYTVFSVLHLQLLNL